MMIPHEAVDAGWHASERTTRTEVARIIEAALPHMPGQWYGRDDELTLVATRGERTIAWKCIDVRERRAMTAQFLAQGYSVV